MLMPVSTRMPSSAKTFSISSLVSGSSGASSRSATSSTVTCEPNRANAWASSQPIGPPPMTASEAGSSATFTISRLVQYGVSASPSIGSRAGDVPTLSTTPRAPTYSSSPTRTVPVPASRPSPRTIRTPAASSRSTWESSRQWLVACLSSRVATAPQSGETSALPARSSTRRASASALAARIIILDGMQP